MPELIAQCPGRTLWSTAFQHLQSLCQAISRMKSPPEILPDAKSTSRTLAPSKRPALASPFTSLVLVRAAPAPVAATANSRSPSHDPRPKLSASFGEVGAPPFFNQSLHLVTHGATIPALRSPDRVLVMAMAPSKPSGQFFATDDVVC